MELGMDNYSTDLNGASLQPMTVACLSTSVSRFPATQA